MLLKWYTFVGAFLYRLHVPNAFGERAGLGRYKPCLSSGCAGSYHFGRGGSIDGGQELEPAEVGLSLLSGCHFLIKGKT